MTPDAAPLDEPIPERSARRIHSELFWLALPVLAEQLLAFCVTFFDTYLSGRLGKEETAAIGLAAYLSWLASMIFGLVGTGATALVARAWGAGRFEEANRLATRALTLALGLGVTVCLLLQVLAPWATWLLGMEGRTRDIAIHFLRIDACGQIFAAWTLIGAAALRGSGDMRTPLFVLGVVNLVNVAVSVSLVTGLGPLEPTGVSGIVLGTVTAQVCGALLMGLALSSSAWTKLRLMRREFVVRRDTTLRFLRIGAPAAVDGMITFAGHFLFLMIIARTSARGFDGANFAAHTVGIRFEAISYLPAVAWGYAAASLVGRRLGAGKPQEALAAGKAAAAQCLPYAFLASVLFFAFAPQIYAFMHTDPAVHAAGIGPFRLMALYQVPNALLIIYTYALRGAGDTTYPLLCAALGNLCIRVPLAWLFGIYLEWGLFGAWLGMGADNLTRCLLIAWRYHAGRWLATRV